jgi:hypothetical protein
VTHKLRTLYYLVSARQPGEARITEVVDPITFSNSVSVIQDCYKSVKNGFNCSVLAAFVHYSDVGDLHDGSIQRYRISKINHVVNLKLGFPATHFSRSRNATELRTTTNCYLGQKMMVLQVDQLRQPTSGHQQLQLPMTTATITCPALKNGITTSRNIRCYSQPTGELEKRLNKLIDHCSDDTHKAIGANATAEPTPQPQVCNTGPGQIMPPPLPDHVAGDSALMKGKGG